jgi:type I restriction-modification system DNA methylase subunit
MKDKGKVFMPTNIQTIKNFPQLIKYLRTDLGWPVDEEAADNLTFDYDPEELGLDEKSAVKVRAAKQLRPLVAGQPWGIFWIDFEPKKLPITVMRRILNQLVAKKRGGKSQQATWNLDDLLFISAVGSEKSDQREITFAHFHQEEGDLPTLRVLGWDGADTVLKIDYVAKTLKEKLLWPQNPKNVQAWRATWAEAFKHKPGHVIKTADALAARLAELARSIRAAAETIMKHETEKGRLRKLHRAFQTALIHDLTEEDFADTYAQTITYGLLTAAISRTDMSGGSGGTALVAENIKDMVPVTNPFLREMLGTFLSAGGRNAGGRRGDKHSGGIDFDELGIQDVVELLRSDETDLPTILRDFNNRAEGEDPVIRFYEDFLEAYDKALKVQRGVFFTPKPVVSYIVRGVHELLQTEFGLEDGLASTVTWGEMHIRNAEVKIPKGIAPNSFFAMILDPATGTATFLVEVIDVIYKTMVAKWKKQAYKDAQIQAAWNEYVPTSLLPRLYGYELMMAPYAIAHMKIGLKLYETGYRFASDQRANIYLTNALEEPSQLAQGSAASLFEALGHESQAVNDVKRDVHFTVVIGNPPYSGHSSNASKNEDRSWNFIGKLLQDYYQIDGKPLGEKNPKWLQDDYVKFLRFGQWNISQSQIGILAMITNHGYLDNPTFRGMRQQLANTFSDIYLLDLHGNSKKQEVAQDGSKDENVFDITQGVSICLMAKLPSSHENTGIHHADLFGLREFKYEYLMTHHSHLNSTEWSKINPKTSYYLFSPQNIDLDTEYQKFWKITEVMPVNSVGVVTARDSLTIQWTPEQVYKTVKNFTTLSTEKARTEYSLGSDARDWKVSFAQKDILESGTNKSKIIPILYRPFDTRFTYYTGQSRGFICMPRPNVMQHFISHRNLAFHLCRQVRIAEWRHILATNQVTDDCYVSNITSERGYTHPLYLYPESESRRGRQHELFGVQAKERRPNLELRFIVETEKKYNLRFVQVGLGDLRQTFGPEDVFHYMYAVLHSPTYRSRYAEFLKLDFPRLPLTSNVTLFCQLCGLGKELVGLHLLEASVLNKPIAKFKGKGDNVVAKGHPKYQVGAVLINSSQCFECVPEDVWEFHIGGYQVCEKWLKDRRGRELSEEDIVHYQKVVVALKETIRLMREIDEVIEVHGGWPIK